VIVGAGFGGLSAARELARSPVRVTVIDRSNYHLFQPLLYQVATAGLSPADIAVPIRVVLRRQRNAEVMLAEVNGVDLAAKTVRILERGADPAPGPGSTAARERVVPFDQLVLATGSRHGYFGHGEWEQFAPGLKSISDATTIRRRILGAFERAEMESEPARRRALMTFVIVGGGPSGVELAGSLAELSRAALERDFRHIDPASARILLVEASPRILMSFSPELSARARRELERMGVEISAGRVTGVDASGVTIGGDQRTDGGASSVKRVDAATVIWAAGVVASPAARWLGLEGDRAGRARVESDLTVPGHPDIFVAGDTALVAAGDRSLPGLAPVAMQEGRYIGQLIHERAIRGDLTARGKTFVYRDKGNLATVGRAFAIAEIGRLKLAGRFAWLTWVVVHVYYLIGFRNRVLVLAEWAWAYLTFQRGARLMVGRD
jgi:NADH dehydrogenase